MKNPKMKEVFKHFNGVAIHIDGTCVNEEFNDGVEPWDAIDRALSEFDGLVEEGEKLTTENERLKALLKEADEWMDADIVGYWSSSLSDRIDEALNEKK